MDSDLTILLPAHNEERAIGLLIKQIMDEVHIPYVLLVINNASSDNTRNVALAGGAAVLLAPEKGKGNAVRKAIKAIATPYVIMMNADLTYPPAYVKLLYEELVKGAEVVLGTRTIVDRGAMPFMNSIGNWGLSLLASTLYGYHVYDICTGMWGFRTSALTAFSLTSTHFTLEADMFVNAVKNQNKIRQVPIGYRARLDGDRPKLKVSDGLRIGKFLLCKRFGR